MIMRDCGFYIKAKRSIDKPDTDRIIGMNELPCQASIIRIEQLRNGLTD